MKFAEPEPFENCFGPAVSGQCKLKVIEVRTVEIPELRVGPGAVEPNDGFSGRIGHQANGMCRKALCFGAVRLQDAGGDRPVGRLVQLRKLNFELQFFFAYRRLNKDSPIAAARRTASEHNIPGQSLALKLDLLFVELIGGGAFDFKDFRNVGHSQHPDGQLRAFARFCGGGNIDRAARMLHSAAKDAVEPDLGNSADSFEFEFDLPSLPVRRNIERTAEPGGGGVFRRSFPERTAAVCGEAGDTAVDIPDAGNICKPPPLGGRIVAVQCRINRLEAPEPVQDDLAAVTAVRDNRLFAPVDRAAGRRRGVNRFAGSGKYLEYRPGDACGCCCGIDSELYGKLRGSGRQREDTRVFMKTGPLSGKIVQSERTENFPVRTEEHDARNHAEAGVSDRFDAVDVDSAAEAECSPTGGGPQELLHAHLRRIGRRDEFERAACLPEGDAAGRFPVRHPARHFGARCVEAVIFQQVDFGGGGEAQQHGCQESRRFPGLSAAFLHLM